MKGYKTWIASVGSMAAGIAMIADGLSTSDTPMGIDPNKIYQGIMMILAGLALVGIGHKIEKASE